MRKAGLAACVAAIHRKEPMAKIVVFAPIESSTFANAAAAVQALDMPSEVIHPSSDDQDRGASVILEFNEPPIEETYRTKCRVLLLSFQDNAGANLQDGSHHVIFYAPIVGAMRDTEKIVAAVGKEQQSIGRLRRPRRSALTEPPVTVHRLVLHGPNDEPTIDVKIKERNETQLLIEQAGNTA